MKGNNGRGIKIPFTRRMNVEEALGLEALLKVKRNIYIEKEDGKLHERDSFPGIK